MMNDKKESGADESLLESPSEKQALPPEQDVQELHAQIETLNAALQEESEKAKNNWDRLLRKEAELQNLQRRSQQDVENARKFASEQLASELLQVLDSFEQGLSYGQNNQASLQDLIQGIELTHSVLLKALEKHGVTVIEPKVKDTFNPSFHEAISVLETKEMEPNRIVAVVQKGYMLHNRLLRPARVVVAKAPQ
jgi:molecular chaperone GrpE